MIDGQGLKLIEPLRELFKDGTFRFPFVSVRKRGRQNYIIHHSKSLKELVLILIERGP